VRKQFVMCNDMDESGAYTVCNV